MRCKWVTVVIALCLCLGNYLQGAGYPLSSGEVINAEPFDINASGVVFRYPDGHTSARVGWTNFTEAALKDFSENPKAKNFVAPFLPTEEDVQVKKEITVKQPPRIDRPQPRSAFAALFASPLSIVLVALVYFANLYAAYEISVYRKYPRGMVVGAAAILPIAAPVVFLCMPTRTEEVVEEVAHAPVAEPPPERPAAPASPARPAAAYTPPARFSTPGSPAPAAAAPVSETESHETVEESPPPPAAPKWPEPVVYRRGQTMFNRRFFETKLAGFLRMVPSDAEKDMVIYIKSARGEYTGNRISKLQPEDLTLQFHRGTASSDVTIPFTEIQEVTIKHKDA